MSHVKKENIEIYSKREEPSSRPKYGEQWDRETMDYLLDKGPLSLVRQMLKKNAKEPCLVLGLATELEIFNPFYKKIIGVNIAKEEFQLVKKGGIEYDLIVCDAEKLPFQDSSFKNVIAFSVLHHIDTPKGIQEIKRILFNKGFFYVLEPGKFNPIAVIGRKIFPTNIHVKSEKPFNPSELKKLVSNVGKINFEGYYIIFSIAIPIFAKHWKLFKSKKIIDVFDKIDLFLSRIGLKNLSWVLVFGATNNKTETNRK